MFDRKTRVTVATLAFTGAVGGFTLKCNPGENTGSAGDIGTYQKSRSCWWSLKLTLADTRTVQLWGPDDEFVIHQEGPTT